MDSTFKVFGLLLLALVLIVIMILIIKLAWVWVFVGLFTEGAAVATLTTWQAFKILVFMTIMFWPSVTKTS